ncbi:MAG: DUF4112 domain-containing protein [Henriciella sp.]|uniref:DUF4112 domain-containing protein n=1 Tax=Henriciella sp. TaxID=1968823 RepID=UPI003C739B6F
MMAGRRDDIDRLATLLDARFKIPGTGFRFGLDSIVGLIPGVGDAITGGLGLYLVHRARQEGVPGHVTFRMLWNLLVDTLLGAIPLVGDIFDFAFKANLKNARMLQKHLDKQQADLPGRQ